MSVLSHVQLFATPRTLACQAPLFMEFPRQGNIQYWNGLPFPSPGDLPNPGIWAYISCTGSWVFIIEPPGKPDYILILYILILYSMSCNILL